MMPWPICSSSRLIGAVAALGLPLAGDAASPPPADVRPDVAVVMSVAGPLLTLALPPPTRDSLLGLMRETLPPVLERNVGFLDWRPSGPGATDTLELRWMQRAGDPQDAMLQLVLRGRRIKTQVSTDPLTFERWDALLGRTWRPAELSRDWTSLADTLLQRRQELVPSLFGLLPLGVDSNDRRIRPDNQGLKVVLDLRPDEIRAAESPAPEFLLKVLVEEPGPPTSVGPGSLKLRGCNRTTSGTGYVCRMGQFIYQDDTTTAEARRQLLAGVKLVPTALHLLRYTAAGVPTGPGGTLGP